MVEEILRMTDETPTYLQYIDHKTLASGFFSDVFVVEIDKKDAAASLSPTNSIIRRIRSRQPNVEIGAEYSNDELLASIQPEIAWIKERGVDFMVFTGDRDGLFDMAFFVFGEKENAALFKTFFG